MKVKFFNFLHLVSFFLSSLEKRNRNALVLIVSWKFQDLNYSKVFIFCPFDSSLVAACYECFFLRWYCIAQDISPYNCIQIGGCRMHFAVLIWYSMHATDTGANVSIINIAWGAFAYESFQWNLIGWIEYPFKNIISVY